MAEGERAEKLKRRREKEQEAFKRKLEETEKTAKASKLVGFAQAGGDEAEKEFQESTVGLKSREEWAKEREGAERRVREARERAEREREEAAEERRKRRARASAAKLSFLNEEADEDDGPPEAVAPGNVSLGQELSQSGQKPGKDPSVETRFLPDRRREEEEERMKDELREEYKRKREKEEQESIEVEVSFWGQGGGRRRAVQVRKGDPVSQIVRAAKDELSREHRELRASSTEQLLLVKDDRIIPHRFTVYDIMERGAVGASGKRLFAVGGSSDGKAAKEESGSIAKIVHRTTYERQKHIYPFSVWQQLHSLPLAPPSF